MKEREPEDFLGRQPLHPVPASLDRKIDQLIGMHEARCESNNGRTVPLWLCILACLGFLWLGRQTGSGERSQGIEIRQIERLVFVLDRPNSGARNIFDIQPTQDLFLNSPEHIEVRIREPR